ncbi:carbon-nitrogen family hydrolase [Candidatus Fermentibacteria bacterium]|nr:carbon-nitrogen family hydrolase [Candidatus Fermentibacteria bacterium]
MRLAEVETPPEGRLRLDNMLEAVSVAPVVDLVVFPELFACGYDPLLVERCTISEADAAGIGGAFSRAFPGAWIAAGTWPVRRSDGALLNRLLIFSPDDRLACFSDKVHLFRDMGEDEMFSPGLPSGVFDMGGTGAGAFVCYDLRFPEMSRRLALSGARLIVVTARWPEKRTDLFRCLLRARAAENQVFVAGCNAGGGHLGVRFMGGGAVAAPSGNLVEGTVVAPGVTDYDIDLEEVTSVRRRIDCLRYLRPGVY